MPRTARRKRRRYFLTCSRQQTTVYAESAAVAVLIYLRPARRIQRALEDGLTISLSGYKDAVTCPVDVGAFIVQQAAGCYAVKDYHPPIAEPPPPVSNPKSYHERRREAALRDFARLQELSPDAQLAMERELLAIDEGEMRANVKVGGFWLWPVNKTAEAENNAVFLRRLAEVRKARGLPSLKQWRYTTGARVRSQQPPPAALAAIQRKSLGS